MHFDPRDYDYGLHYRTFHDESQNHISDMVEYHRRQLQPYLPKSTTAPVLDIGCGMGFALQMLQAAGFSNCTGIDIDSGQVATCQRHGLSAELVIDTTAFLQDRTDKFSLILMLDVLEHVPVAAQIPLMRAVFSALSPSGRLIVQVPNANAAIATRWRYIDFTHTSSFTEHSLGFVFRAAGFDDFRIPGEGPLGRPPVKLWTRAARHGLRRWLVSWLWRQITIAQLGDIDVDSIPFGLNLLGIADKPPGMNG